MQQANTKSHWLALLIARYYDQTGEAARGRDLWPYAQHIYDEPDHMSAGLHYIHTNKDIVDSIQTRSPGKDAATDVMAYYPTEDTIETLELLDVPSYLPDGTEIPDAWDISIPESYVDDPENVTVTIDDDETGLDYAYADSGKDPDGHYKTYNKTNVRRSPDIDFMDSDDAPSDDAGDSSSEQDAPPSEHDESPDDDSDDSEGKPLTHPQPSIPATPDGLKMDSQQPGRHAGEVDWNRIATRLERKAEDAHEAGLTEIAAAYSQFANVAVSGDLDKRTAYMLLGTPILDIEAPTGTSTTYQPGTHAGEVDWNRIATRLERKAEDAHEAGLTEIAAAYSQFANVAVTGDLDKRTAYMLLGTPILDIEAPTGTSTTY